MEMQKVYKDSIWKDDLKKLLKQTGSRCMPSVFLLQDNQILKESQLEDINNILNSGDVNNLMAVEDYEEIF